MVVAADATITLVAMINILRLMPLLNQTAPETNGIVLIIFCDPVQILLTMYRRIAAANAGIRHHSQNEK